MSEKSFCNVCQIEFDGARCPTCDGIAYIPGTDNYKGYNLQKRHRRRNGKEPADNPWMRMPDNNEDLVDEADVQRVPTASIQPGRLADHLDGVWWSKQRNMLISINTMNQKYRSWHPKRKKTWEREIELLIPEPRPTTATLKLDSIEIFIELLNTGELQLSADGTALRFVKLADDASWIVCTVCFGQTRVPNKACKCGHSFKSGAPTAPNDPEIWKRVRAWA